MEPILSVELDRTLSDQIHKHLYSQLCKPVVDGISRQADDRIDYLLCDPLTEQLHEQLHDQLWDQLG